MTFLYLHNLGSPTRWDAAGYFSYRDKFLHALPDDILSMISDQRFQLDSNLTFWYSQLISVQYVSNDLELTFQSASESTFYVFSYSGVKRINSDFHSYKAMPAMIVQELTVKTGVYRHAISDFGGRCVVIWCESMRFAELNRH